MECRKAEHCDSLSALTGKSYLCSDENSASPNKCYEVACTTHNSCPAKHVCIDNSCVPTECRVNSECAPNHLCHKTSKEDPTRNKCKPTDCTSNSACKNHSNAACKDGKCLCEDHTCVVKRKWLKARRKTDERSPKLVFVFVESSLPKMTYYYWFRHFIPVLRF